MSDPRNFSIVDKMKNIPEDVKQKVRAQVMALVDDSIATGNPFMFTHMNSHETCVIFGSCTQDMIIEMIRSAMIKWEDTNNG